MSSFSSNKSSSMMCITTDQPNNAKNYICPRCNKFYDFQLAGNNFVGRIPLILNCKHTLCQDCIYKIYPSKNIICGECHTSNFLTDLEIKKKADQVFPVNYYILGVITYHKRFGQDSSSFNFKPAGYQFKQNERGYDPKPQSFLNFNTTSSKQNFVDAFNFKIEEPQQVCSQLSCKNDAKVNCDDCDEIFCKQCCDTLHNSAKGLKKHKITPLSLNSSLELTATCTIHQNSLIEFCCNTCQQNLCCYCMLGEHNGHIYYQFTDMNEEKKRQLQTLIENAEEILKKLIISEKKVRNQINKVSKPNLDSPIQLSISKKIENAVSKLQILEKQLLTEAHQYNNLDRTALISLLETVVPNIRNINNLVTVGREVLEKNTSSKKLNIELIKSQLEGIMNTPCYFIENLQKREHSIEFSFDDSLIDDIQDSSKLKYNKNKSYTLVTKEDLPEDYVEQDIEIDGSPTSLMSSCSSLRDGPDKQNGVGKSKRMTKVDQVEKWIHSANDRFPKSNIVRELELLEMPVLQKGAKESVKVSHLSSPECFYVQLNRLSGSLNKLIKSIGRHVKNTVIVPVLIPEISSLYLVKYMSEEQTHWCRGRIMEEMEEKNMFLTYFIDYGNTATVRKDDILAMPPDLKKYPPFALECTFFDLYPPKNNWDPKALVLMMRIIANNDLLMIVIERQPAKLAVDLINLECMTSIRDSLKFLGYGIPYCKYPTDLDKLKKDLKSNESVKLYNKSERFKKEDSIDVIISYVIDPYNIYINIKNSRDNLIKLHKQMDQFYKKSKKGYIYAPKEDMVVAVLYSDGKSRSWRRGIITKSTEGRGTVTVRLVDIGMVLTVSWDQIRKLDPLFVSIDCQAILVKMTDITPRNEQKLWSQNAIDYFTKFVKSETVLKMVVSETAEPPQVLFFECFPTVHHCLNAILVRDGLADSTGDLSITVEWPQIDHEKAKLKDTFTMSMMKTIQATAHEATAIDGVDSDDEDCNMYRKTIQVISADSPDVIHFRFTDVKERLHEFQLELRDFYSKTKLIHLEWSVGDVCVVYHKKQYYRSIIQEVLPNKKYLVNLKDVAVSVEVKEKQIGVLEPDFMKVPEFALRCHLADIKPAGGTTKWSAMACEFLQDILQKHDRLFLAKKGAVDKERKSLPAVIWYVQFLPGGALESSKSVLHSINKLLLKNGLALKAAVPKSKPNEEEVTTEKEENEINDSESIKSTNTETEDHECSSSLSESSVAGALLPSTSGKVDWNDLIEMQKQCPEQIIQDWISPLPFKSNEFTAIPTFVNDDGEIFLHEIDLEPTMKQMEEKMFEYLNSRRENYMEERWNAGEMCSVKYHLNEKWYRGKILNVTGPNIKVIMIDYGNEEDCTAKDLSKEILYYDLPIFANRVTLDGVYSKSNKWLTSDSDILHAQIVEKTVHVTLKSQQIIGLSTPAVINLGPININKFILEHTTNLSRIKRPKISAIPPTTPIEPLPEIVKEPSILDSSDCDVIVQETSSSSEDEANENEINYFDIDEIFLKYEQRPLPETKKDEKFKIAIINILNYNKIIFEIPSDSFEKDKEAFENLSKEINSSINELENLEIFDAETPCIAKYPEDDQWYRAQIIQNVDEKKICVWFVDFGNFEYISKETAKELKEEWLEFPVEHHLATIDGISLNDEKNRDKVLSHLVTFYESAQMAQIVSKEPLRIELYKIDSEELSYQSLIEFGYLKIDQEEEGDDDDEDDTIDVEVTSS